MVRPEARQILGTASSSKANAIITRKDVDDFPIDPQLLIYSERTTEMTSVVAKSGPPISTKEMTSEYDIGKSVVHLSEEESENAVYLLEIVTGTSDDSESLMAETPETEYADLLGSLENLHPTSGDDSHPFHCSPELFITNFSKINVIRNDTAGDLGQEKFEESAGTWVATGNSRDVPSRLLFYCPNEVWGCDYNTPKNLRIGEHTRRCKISRENLVKPSTFKCRKGCNNTFKDEGTRNKHERDHDFKPRQCQLGCTDGVWYKKEQDWRSHKSRKHDADWDTSMLCQIPECTRTTGFAHRELYQAHLRDVHRLSGKDAAKYIPEKKNKDPVWGKRSCPFPDCVRAAPGREIGRKSEMEAHLKTARGGHQCTPEQINDLIQQILSE
jgi:hypothetical protein